MHEQNMAMFFLLNWGANIWVLNQKYGKTPKSSILIGFSIVNHPFWDTPIFEHTHISNWMGVKWALSSCYHEIFSPFFLASKDGFLDERGFLSCWVPWNHRAPRIICWKKMIRALKVESTTEYWWNIIHVHPWKLTWNLKILLGTGETTTNHQFWGFHVSFRGCKTLLYHGKVRPCVSS